MLQRALHAGGGIDIAAAQHGEDLPELGVDREPGESGELVIQSVGQDALGGGARLHGDTLTRKVLDRADPAVRTHDDRALGVEVGTGPEKFVLTAIHRQAAPQTVDLARGKTGKALIERDLAKNGLIADATAGLGRDLHVDACVAAAHIAVKIRRVGGAADDKLRHGIILLRRRGAGGEHEHCAEEKKREKTFHKSCSFIKSTPVSEKR